MRCPVTHRILDAATARRRVATHSSPNCLLVPFAGFGWRRSSSLVKCSPGLGALLVSYLSGLLAERLARVHGERHMHMHMQRASTCFEGREAAMSCGKEGVGVGVPCRTAVLVSG